MIPKIVHISWRDKSIINDRKSPLLNNGLHNIISMNPDWQVVVSDDQDIDQYLKSNLDPIDYQLVKQNQFVAQCDLWRLIKLYQEGGLYIDIDRFYNIPMSSIIDSDTRCLLPTNGDYDFSQDLMCSAPENPIFLRAIELNLARRRQGQNRTYYLGPQTYMHAVTELVVGQQIDTNPGKEIFDLIRQELSKFNFIRSYREVFPADTIVYRGDLNAAQLEQFKKQFYQKYQVVHWTEE